MAHLYIDYQGRIRNRHSYSAGSEFDQNPYKYFLRRIMGWSEKDTKASLMFGRDLEAAIQFYHEHSGEGAVEEFARLWAARKDQQLKYTDRERTWESLDRAGREMMKLYWIKQPELPMPMGTRFQREVIREIFPGDPKLGGIEFYGKLDATPLAPPNHPMLKRVEWDDRYGLVRPVIVDIKTSGDDFPDIPGLCAQDFQLRTYSWLYGKRDVAFLWFKKNLHELKKGTSVTLLQKAGRYEAGDEAVVAYNDDGVIFLLKNDFEMEEMKKYIGDKPTTNEGKARRIEFLQNAGTLVEADWLTRQRIQFNSGIVSIDSAEDAGRHIQSQVRRIVEAYESNVWPNTFGVRFPHDDTNDPYFKAFVMGDSMFREQFFEKRGEETMDDFGEAAE